jgi:hypothetical protein
MARDYDAHRLGVGWTEVEGSRRGGRGRVRLLICCGRCEWPQDVYLTAFTRVGVVCENCGERIDYGKKLNDEEAV